MRLARVRGIDLRANPFFILMLLIFSSIGLVRETLVLFWVVLLHELAHVAVGSCLGLRASSIELLPFGGVVVFAEPLAANPAAEAVTAAAGPIHNFVVACLAALAERHAVVSPSLGRFLVEANLALGAFNLLPAIPLDGGRILRAALSPRVGTLRATAIAADLGRLVGAAVLAGGSALAYAGRCNVFVPAMGGFLLFAAARERRFAPYDRIRATLRRRRGFVEEGVATAHVLAVMDSAMCRDVARRFGPGKLGVILVFDARLELRAVVTEFDVMDAMVRHGADAPVRVLIG